MNSCNQDPQCGSSPIVVDLAGEGFALTSAAEGVDFDFYGTGKKIRLGWTSASSRNAWLVLDRNNDGLIENGREMFGNLTPQPKSPHPNGYLALAVFDDPEQGGNGNGIIDSRDQIFASLRLWVDQNHNGISEPAELFTLPALGVNSISLNYKLLEKVDQYGNRFRYKSTIQGTLGSLVDKVSYDVFLTTGKPVN